MTKQEKLIYLAGFVDGEGCFSILMTKPGGKYRYKKYKTPAISISNTNKTVLEWIKSNFGGCVCHMSYTKGNRNECWQWRLSWTRAVTLAKKLQPYLIVKKEQVQRIMS